MKRVVKKTCKVGGSAVMLGMFWTGAVLIGASIAINYTIHKKKGMYVQKR
tara:strand:- start:70 stop:219 length:150 start_codon:yes stop_codon:yes gene_type:complete